MLKVKGVHDIAISTGFKAEAFLIFEHQKYFNPNFERTNMVESLISARDFFEGIEEDLIISYGDIVYQKDNLEKVLETRGDVVVMVDDDWLNLWSIRNDNPLIDAETMKFDSYDGRIIEVGKKPTRIEEIESQYTGLIKISANKIQDVLMFYDSLDRNILYQGNTFPNMYMTTFLQLLIDAEWKVVPARVNNGWLEVDTVNDLLMYERLNINGELDNFWRHEK